MNSTDSSDSDSSHIQIAVLYNLEKNIKKGKPQDLIALQDTAQTAQAIYQALRELGYRVLTIAVNGSLEGLEEELSTLSRENTFIFNVCDGLNGENRGAIKIVRLIEKLGFKHTGSPADVIRTCINKKKTKERLVRYGIPTPRFQVFDKPLGFIDVKFPVIVKPLTEDGSIGIDLDSVTCDPDGLFSRVRYVLDTYRQSVMAEEFIVGRELAVAMWGNHTIEVLPMYEDDYSQISDPLKCLLTYEAKWVVESPYYQNIHVRCPALLDPYLEQRVTQVALSTYQAIGLRDFGRVDIRLYGDTPYVIDVNELPDLAPGSGFPNTALAAGYTYTQLIEKILKLALTREGWI